MSVLEEYRAGRIPWSDVEQFWRRFEFIHADAMIAADVLGRMIPFLPDEVVTDLGIREIWESVSGFAKSLLPGDIWRWDSLTEAVRWLFRSRITLPRDVERVQERARADARSSAGMISDETKFAVKAAIQESIRYGESMEEFRARMREVINLPRHVEETLYRTNMKGKYLDGLERTLASRKTRHLFPYVMYRATPDDKVRPWHWALDGMVAEIGSPLYAVFMSVQREYNCRCALLTPPKRLVRPSDVKTVRDLPPEWMHKYFPGRVPDPA